MDDGFKDIFKTRKSEINVKNTVGKAHTNEKLKINNWSLMQSLQIFRKQGSTQVPSNLLIEK